MKKTKGGIWIDAYSAKDILTYMKNLSSDNKEIQDALQYLASWDCYETAESGEAALYAIFWVELMKITFIDKLPPKQLPLEETVALLLKNKNSKWGDDKSTIDKIEDRDTILLKAFINAYKNAKKLMGSNLRNWKWGNLHAAVFKDSILGSVPVLGNLFNRGPVKVPGGPGIINSIGWAIGDKSDSSKKSTYEVTWLPSMRMIVDLNDLNNSLIIHTTGQSSHPYNKNYDDMIELWWQNKYHEQLWNRLSIESEAKDHLTLIP